MADRRVRAIFEVQVTQAERGMKSLAGEVEKADKKVDALGKTLDGLGKKRTKVEIEADIQDAERRVSELEAHLDDLQSMEVTPEVRADTEKAKAELSDVKTELRDLYNESAEVTVTADGSRARGELADVQDRATKLDGDTATVRVDANTSGAESAIDDLGEKIDDLGDGAGDGIENSLNGALRNLAGKASLAGAAIAVGKVIAGGINEGIQSELRVDLMAAGSGMDPESAARAGEAAQASYWGAFADSKDQGAEILAAAFRAGIIDDSATQSAMEDLIAKVTSAANVFNMSWEDSVRAVGLLMRNDLVNDADEAFNVIYALGQQDPAGDLLDTITEYSVQFHTLGLDAETAGGLMAQALDAGAYDTDKVADSLKELGVKLRETTSDTEPMAQALDNLGLNWRDVVDGFNAGGDEAAAAMQMVFDAMRDAESQGKLTGDIITDLFGGPGEDVAKAALLALDIDTATESLYGMADGAGYADSVITQATGNSATVLESLKRSLTDVTFWTQAHGDAMDDVRNVNAAWGGAMEEATDSTTGMGNALGEVVGTLAVHADAADDATDAQGDFESATDGVNDELSIQADILETVIDGQRRLSGITMTAVEAEGEFHQSVRDATAALAENGQTLDVTTEAGLANMEALHGIADAGWDHIDALREQGASEQVLQGVMADTRQAFIDSMIEMGATEQAAHDYADQLGLIPSHVSTEAAFNDAAARERLNWWRRQKVTVGVNFVAGSQSGSLGSPVAPYVPGNADGGWVPGAPSTVDTVAWPVALPGRAGGGYLNQPLAGGEYVVNARSAGANAALVEAINASRGPLTLSPASPSSFEASLVGARVEIGADGLGRFVDGRIEVRDRSRLRDVRARAL